MCVFVSGEQMDSAISLCCCHPYYLQECDMSVPWGMGTKEESCHPTTLPPRPPISLSGRHLPHLQPTAAWSSFSPRTLGKREGESAANLTHVGPRGRSWSVVATSAATACCLTACDNRRCGMGVWYGL